MKIEKMVKSDQGEAVTVFRQAYQNIEVPEDEEAWFVNDLEESFSKEKPDSLEFHKISKDNEMVSFGAIGPLPFTRGAWMLRWGTTLPEMQGQGLMTELTKFRLQYASEHTEGFAGNVQLMSRRPNLYKKLGFREIYRRGPENAATHMIKIINEDMDVLGKE